MLKRIVSSIVHKLRPYFDRLLEEMPDGSLSLYDTELARAASCCTTGEAAAFYVLDQVLHGGDGLVVARRLAQDVARRQLPDGAFGQPFYVKKGEPDTVDLAEVGAVANSLYWVHRTAGSGEAKESLLRSARYLLTQAVPLHPGAFYKNSNALGHDVLNGDMYAAHSLARAFELTQKEEYRRATVSVFEHLISRFGQHEQGWWPYTELWDGRVGMGNSVSYQAIIVGFAVTAMRILPEPLQAEWERTAGQAAKVILRELQAGPGEGNEAPWWCRNWTQVWEIDLALSRFPHLPGAKEYVSKRLEWAEERLEREGTGLFTPAAAVEAPADRSPVSTTFRKAATFAGVLAYMMLDESYYGGN